VLTEGGKPQSHANARKNLDLIHQFFCWATTRGGTSIRPSRRAWTSGIGKARSAFSHMNSHA
jgi:hypothetical protein